MLFINDFTRMCWVSFLKKMSEAFKKFKAFKIIVENEIGEKLKCLRFENGGESPHDNLISFVKTMESRDIFQLSGHLNGTIQEVARTILSEAKPSDGYWREAISTAVYILNIGQLRVNSKKIPYELWYGRTPSVTYFRVFGSKCYIKNLDTNLGKFDARSDEGIFIGYASNKIDDLKTQKIKHQKSTSDSESEEDEEFVSI